MKSGRWLEGMFAATIQSCAIHRILLHVKPTHVYRKQIRHLIILLVLTLTLQIS
jgi:hypothetical protein